MPGKGARAGPGESAEEEGKDGILTWEARMGGGYAVMMVRSIWEFEVESEHGAVEQRGCGVVVWLCLGCM
jgi:hypothetical protein